MDPRLNLYGNASSCTEAKQTVVVVKDPEGDGGPSRDTSNIDVAGDSTVILRIRSEKRGVAPEDKCFSEDIRSEDQPGSDDDEASDIRRLGKDAAVPQTTTMSISKNTEPHAHYPSEEDNLLRKKSVDNAEQRSHSSSARTIVGSGIEYLKYLYSMTLLVFSVAIVMTAIFTDQTSATTSMDVSPVAACVVFWFLVIWLAMMEGGQGCIVGLQPVDKSLYAESHKITHRITTLVHYGDNTERFIVGRQFLVVLVLFVINMCGAAVAGANVFDLPETVAEIFLGSGIAMILTTIIIGQLAAQVNAANCMLDFINNYFMLFTVYVSLAIEMSGLMHSVYLVQIIFSKIAGAPMGSKGSPRTLLQKFFFWSRVVFSLTAFGFSFAVTLKALFNGQTTMYSGVPTVASVVLLFFLVCFVGLMEGMQIALFAVVNLPEAELKDYPMVAQSCELTFRGSNLQAFLIGRQICVTCCMFVAARITSCNVDVNAGEDTIFGVSAGIQSFFNTGLLGAIVTTIVGSLAWRVVASSFPVAFLSNPLVYLIIRLCLILEASGLCAAAWVLAFVHRSLGGLRPDELLIVMKRVNSNNTDDDDDLELQERTHCDEHSSAGVGSSP